jgi:hypothetical protein
MNPTLVEPLEICLQILEKGGTLEDCLARFPSLASDLRPFLESAQTVRGLDSTPVSVNAITRGRVRVLNRAAQLRKNPAPRAIFPFVLRLATTSLLVITIISITGNGLIGASANAIPGDALYPVKRSVEDIRLKLAPDVKDKATIQKEFSSRRIKETEILLSEKRIETVEFEGQVSDQLPDGWLVAGIPVRMTGQTIIEGELSVGVQVEVQGHTQSDGSVLAELIKVSVSSSPGAGTIPPGSLNEDDDSSDPEDDAEDETPEAEEPDDHSSGSANGNGHEGNEGGTNSHSGDEHD